MKVCVVGLGLLGGSFSLSLKAIRQDIHVIGVDVNSINAETSKDLGIADEISDYVTGVAQADLVVLAIPVDAEVKIISQGLDLLKPGAIISDMGSTKSGICSAADKHARRGRFVAAHPIAGLENSGPESAFPALMKHKTMIICDREKSDPDALSAVEDIYKSMEMKITFMNSIEHDRHIAWVSHLSHISSFALGSTVLDKEKDERSIFALAGSGFSSTVRLAKSSPDMWAPIFSQNSKNVSEALEAYIKKLQLYKKVIDENDLESSYRLMQEANEIRRVLAGILKNE